MFYLSIITVKNICPGTRIKSSRRERHSFGQTSLESGPFSIMNISLYRGKHAHLTFSYEVTRHQFQMFNILKKNYSSRHCTAVSAVLLSYSYFLCSVCILFLY